MKQCNHCGEWKEDEEFSFRNKLLGIRSNTCKECKSRQDASWYERHSDEQRQRVRDRRKEMRDAAQRFIYEYLSYSTCADCGEYDFAVLTFDHVRGRKKLEISRMVSEGYSIEAIKKELLLCDVVCSNCHMRREQKRRGSSRFEKFWPD